MNITKQLMAQTAINWLLEQAYLICSTKWPEIIDQAKAMEKEQIIKAAIVSHFEGVRQSAKTSKEYLEYGEQYYNETFKSE